MGVPSLHFSESTHFFTRPCSVFTQSATLLPPFGSCLVPRSDNAGEAVCPSFQSQLNGTLAPNVLRPASSQAARNWSLVVFGMGATSG